MADMLKFKKVCRVTSFLLFISALRAGGEAVALDLKSPGFKEGGYIPSEYTCSGENRSPALSWAGLPEGTKSLALVCADPDAPAGTWIHWVIFNIPPLLPGLEGGVPRQGSLPGGIRQGNNDFKEIGYFGPCPPPGRPHRYLFRLYALDGELGLPPGSSGGALEKAVRGHVLAEAKLTGLFGR